MFGPHPTTITPAPDVADVPVFDFPDAAAYALGRVTQYARWRAEPEGSSVVPDGADPAAGRAVVLDTLANRVAGGVPADSDRWLPADVAVDALMAAGLPMVPSRVVHDAAGDLAAAGVQVLHAAGHANTVTVELPAGSPPYVVVPYLERMDLAYAAADLALCRAGANTVAEMAAVGLAAAYVPLPIGNGEQELIARPVVEAGGGLLVDDPACTPAWVRSMLTPLLTEPDRLAAMGAAAARSGRRDADERLADLVRTAVDHDPRGGSG
ncbi:MAG: glycosyltransferase [Actinomycetes bacterium]